MCVCVSVCASDSTFDLHARTADRFIGAHTHGLDMGAFELDDGRRLLIVAILKIPSALSK